MWLIANGAPKSGSTWLFQLFEETGLFKPVPRDLLETTWSNTSISDARVGAALQQLGSSSDLYVTKQHWTAPQARKSPEIAGALKSPGIKMTNIIRDVRDMIVSRYHHQVRAKKCDTDISTFVAAEAPSFLKQYVQYHKYWIENKERNEKNYFLTSYEYMTTDYETAAGELFAFVGNIPEPVRRKAMEANRFENKSEGGRKGFFRKGKIFAFSEEITTADEKQILEMVTELGYKDVKRELARSFPQIRPYLAMTDVGL